MSLLAPFRRRRAAASGVRRSVRLFRLFLAEQSDPEAFYASLASDAVDQLTPHIDLAGRTVVDVGGGGGWFTAGFRARGAHCYLFEPDRAELGLRSELGPPAGAVLADGYWLPVRDGGADVVFSSNVLEHVPDPMGLHEMSPWHYLGAGYARRRYTRRRGRLPKHECGVNLFPVHIGPVLRALRARPDVSIIEARPRYYPRWCRLLVRLPGLREVATWNLLLIMRRAG
jgi:SAM-dependent methyltransferase